MAELSPAGGIPSPEAFVRRQLRQTPAWLQRLASNLLAVISWIGLPSTIISTLTDLRWVVDAAVWVFIHAGVVQPFVQVVGQGISVIVGLWRALTHPIWAALADWLNVALPAWAPDVLTLLALLALGMGRRLLRVMWGHRISGSLMVAGWKPGRAPPEQYIPIPRTFPYTEHFANNGVRWTARRLADAQRLWRQWRGDQIRKLLVGDPSTWPRVREDVIRAQFGRFWLSITEGRRDMAIYAALALFAFGAILADWAYRGILPNS